MKDKHKTDAFSDHFFNNIDIEIHNSFSPKQLSSLKNALKETHTPKVHRIDIRGTINLFFAKYYFVFLMGRDRRISTQETELGRREDVALLGNLSFVLFALSPFVLLVLGLIYFLKIGFGIDIFPEEHMGWILGL